MGNTQGSRGTTDGRLPRLVQWVSYTCGGNSLKGSFLRVKTPAAVYSTGYHGLGGYPPTYGLKRELWHPLSAWFPE